MKPAWYQIRKHLGEQYFFSDGTINRDRLAELVSRDRAQKHALESIMNPEIRKAMYWKLLGYLFRGIVV